VRKQTTANGERYITPELKEFETRVLGAQERALRMESVLLETLRVEILKQTARLQAISQAVAELDAVAGLAEVAERRRYPSPWWTIPTSSPSRKAGIRCSKKSFLPERLFPTMWN